MAEQENVAKSRIINHMNEDHHDSIVRYLEYYHKVSVWRAYDGRMCGIDLNGMTFVCKTKLYNIPFDPPMKSYREARERVVEMDKKCVKALGRSDVAVREFLPPSGPLAIMFPIICATFIAYSQRWWFAQGQVVEQFLGSGFAKFSWVIQPYLIIFMVVVHSSEMLYCMRYKLVQHSINPRTSLFWKWAGTIFIEGVAAIGRFNDLVARKQEEKAKQKH